MRISKKGIEMEFIMFAIVGFIVLILLLTYFSSTLSNSESSADSRACSLLLSQVSGGTTFYNNDLDDFSERFYQFVEQRCPSFKKTLEPKSEKIIAQDILSCYEMFGSGEVILPPEMFGSGVCFYCGELKIDDSSNFDILEEYFSEKGNTKLDITSLKDQKEVGVFFYQYREGVSGLDSVGNYIDTSLNANVAFFREFVDISNPDVSLVTGISFAEITSENVDGEDVRKFSSAGKPFNEQMKCFTIVPLQ